MHKEVKRVLLEAFSAVLSLLKSGTKDEDPFRIVSEQAIEDVAVYKDIDLIAVTVFLYSLAKIVPRLSDEQYATLLKAVQRAQTTLREGDLTKYNRAVKQLYRQVREYNAHIKEHLQDVLDAAKIKKGTSLLHKGLSMGQAAGLMGLSNWDLQQYAGKTTALDLHDEVIPAPERLEKAFALFGVQL